MSAPPVSLRNIPPQALQIAHCLCEQTGLSMADLLRQALVSGLFVEATRFAPDQDGKLGGLEAAYLAKALRRHLSSAIDMLVEYGEHPYQSVIGQSEIPQRGKRQTLPRGEESAAPEQIGEEQRSAVFENAMGEDLEQLGIGMSFAETVGNKGISSHMPE
jgi:hypothetical protein